MTNQYYIFTIIVLVNVLLKSLYSNYTPFSYDEIICYYSQEARTYSLVLLLGIISTILFFRYLKNQKTLLLLVLSFVNFLLIYSHYISGLIILWQYIFILVASKKETYVKYFTIQTLFIVSLVLLRFTSKQFKNILNYNQKEDFWLKKAVFNDLVAASGDLYYNAIVAIVFGVGVLVFLYHVYTNKKENKLVSFYCLSVGFGSVAILYMIGSFKAIFLARYLIFSIPFATILVIDTFIRSVGGKFTIVGLLCLLGINCNLQKNSGVDYKLMARLIRNTRKGSDALIINTKDNLGLFYYYYDNTVFRKYKSLDSVAQTDRIFAVNDTSAVPRDVISNSNRVFLIQSFHKIDKFDNPFEMYLSPRFIKHYHTESIKGIEFGVYRKD